MRSQQHGAESAGGRQRVRSGSAGWLAVACVAVALALPGCAAPSPRHIILIVVDTLRRDHVSPYGADIRTPNVQKLADRGQVYSQAHASFHQTTMSMGALFSGQTPSIESPNPAQPFQFNGRTWCGLARFASQPTEACIPPELTTLPERLRSGGYFTIGVVSNQLLFAPAGFERGFDVWREVGRAQEMRDLAPAERSALRAAPRVNAAVSAALARAQGEPLFLYVHYLDVHDWFALGRGYRESVEAFDRELGELFDALAKEEILDDSVVILTSDHGEALGEAHALPGWPNHRGNPSFESVLRIPLIIAPAIAGDPERFVRSQDLATLILRSAGLPDADPPEGHTPSVAPDELFLTERKFRTYRKGRWKSTFHRRVPGLQALFDLEADPGEKVNLIDAHPDIHEANQRRVNELVSVLGKSAREGGRLTEVDRGRLRVLGYLE